jgi:hypothetical protein
LHFFKILGVSEIKYPLECAKVRGRSTDIRARGRCGRSAACLFQQWVAFAWNNYRGCRIHLHEVLPHCTSLLRPVSSSQPVSLDLDVIDAQSRALIPGLISDICASVLFCLGDIDSTGEPAATDGRMRLAGYVLLCPLHRARASVQEGSEGDIWLTERLEYCDEDGDLSRKTLSG